VVHDRVAFDWAESMAVLRDDKAAARIFLPHGVAPKAGDLHVQPELAATLRLIASQGRDGFYIGPVAEDMASHLRALGGLHTLEDFAATRGDYVAPISTHYSGYEVHQMPPNNQGLTALLMLNILSGFRLGKLDPLGAERLHLEVEVGRLAYRDRDRFIADQEQVAVPTRDLLSARHADQLRALIDPERAMTDLPHVDLPKGDTVYISVVDRDRNAVSFINSTYHSFGSGIVTPHTGIVLQNRGSSFSLDPRHPNCIAPGKRPMHTIMPGMTTCDGKVVMPFGVMGGGYQPFGHVHLLTNMLDFGMDPQAALDAPRVFYDADLLEAERGVPAEAIEGLRRRGHRLEIPYEPHGGGQAIWIDWHKGTLTGASDPRKDGCALGY
jgi:gamma-glutamyltranspeptidase / glutathione hydrolase